ncbi:serine/threonine protein kinase [Paenibacillus sp. HW567]|uniref:serine/threonine protein kinase n=1 Tax=Paenibacillus sp. HW567 TaxID=1034769 RepID=UPI00036E91B8|nr:serine/threonine-protein kinase [Paenibacillus sp. HW567]
MIFESKLRAGEVLGDRYRIVRAIGTGGMSRVFLAEDVRLQGKHWAVKESVSLEGAYGDIEAEAALLISLSHPLLPRVADFFSPDQEGYCYLVMDYIEGVTLGQYISANSGPLPARSILRYAGQLLEVLKYLHGHHPPIVHRDMKPGNIMLTRRDELLLIDFGIARRLRSGAGEDTEKLGTVGFAAPEQYGGGQSHPVSDLYGLGALLLYMASGGQYSRWQPGMEDKLRSRLPAALIPVIRRLLRHHPEDRYQSAEEVMLALEPIEAEVEHAQERRGLSSPAAMLRQGRATTVVALLGVAPGLGTTHTSLAVSSCLARSGSTAWVDASPDLAVYDRICSLFEAPKGDTESPLIWKGVHYWRKAPKGNFTELLNHDYSHVVLDLGTVGNPGVLQEFAASEIPLLVASGADWRLEETLHWLARNGLVPEPGWRICLPLASRASADLLGSALGGKRVHALPYQQDPFQQRGKLIDTLDELLKDQLPGRKYAKRGGIFQKKS